jgi:hypothetical protein
LRQTKKYFYPVKDLSLDPLSKENEYGKAGFLDKIDTHHLLYLGVGMADENIVINKFKNSD